MLISIEDKECGKFLMIDLPFFTGRKGIGLANTENIQD